MGIRGPQSSAALEISSVADLRGDARPEPPEDLTEAQAAEWRAIVGRMPADWFQRETYGLLAQHCRYGCTARPEERQGADYGFAAGHPCMLRALAPAGFRERAAGPICRASQ